LTQEPTVEFSFVYILGRSYAEPHLYAATMPAYEFSERVGALCTTRGSNVSRLAATLLTGVLSFGLSIGAEGCQHKVPRTVVVDEWWSNDHAVEAGWSSCKRDGLSDQYCNSKPVTDDYRQEEGQFTEAFSTAFQADTTCSGIALAVYRGPDGENSQATKIMFRADGYWSFQVNFDPGAKTQRWQMSLTPKQTHSSSGEGTASSIARTVCLIVKGAGGSVDE
jgi:hypothetical protein